MTAVARPSALTVDEAVAARHRLVQFQRDSDAGEQQVAHRQVTDEHVGDGPEVAVHRDHDEHE